MFGFDVFNLVRAVNLQGRLYPVPSDPVQDQTICHFVRAGLVVPVEATSTSPRGYAAVGVLGIASGRREYQS